MCKDSNEDLRHFLFTCMSLNEIRTDEYLKVEMDLCNNGFSDVWISFITSNLDMKLYIMLGYHLNITTPYRQSKDARVAYDIIDKFCKSFLKRAWSVRSKIMNVANCT